MSIKSIEQLTLQAIEDRRHFHQNPELSWQEYHTAKYIKERLQKLNIEILDYPEPHVIGYIKGSKGDKTIALRADMDALPIQEEGDKPYKSKNPGVSHACGHDGHMAVLLAAAEHLVSHKDEISPNILLIFQSCEEYDPSGAKDLVDKGVLEEVDAIYGIHLWQPLKKGKIGIAHGPMMAAADDITITIEGSGGHGSMPHETVDPIYISTHIIQAIQSIVSRNTDPIESKVISIGNIEAGKSYNIIPNTVSMKGTVRGFSLETLDYIENRLNEIVNGICRTFNAKGVLDYRKGTPPLINHIENSKLVENVVRKNFGDTTFEEIKPVMGAEDFSHYLLHRPGAFIFVGMGGEKSKYPHHHPRFDIDEDVLKDAIKLMVEIVKQY